MAAGFLGCNLAVWLAVSRYFSPISAQGGCVLLHSGAIIVCRLTRVLDSVSLCLHPAIWPLMAATSPRWRFAASPQHLDIIVNAFRVVAASSYTGAAAFRCFWCSSLCVVPAFAYFAAFLLQINRRAAFGLKHYGHLHFAAQPKMFFIIPTPLALLYQPLKPWPNHS